MCSVRCATVVRLRDDLWRDIEALQRQQALQPSVDQARQVRSLRAQMEAAEQEFQRLRPLKPLGDQNQHTSEHIAQRGFTRQRELERHELDLWPGGLDCSRLGLGLALIQTGKLHDLGGIYAMANQDGRNLAGQINR
jgi:hypothetical protein